MPVSMQMLLMDTCCLPMIEQPSPHPATLPGSPNAHCMAYSMLLHDVPCLQSARLNFAHGSMPSGRCARGMLMGSPTAHLFWRAAFIVCAHAPARQYLRDPVQDVWPVC